MQIDGLALEGLNWVDRTMKTVLVNPLVNYVIPRRTLKWMVSRSRSEVLHHGVRSPGSWKCMRAAYDEARPRNTVERIVRKYGSFQMGLRNRKRLVEHMLTDLLRGRQGRVNIVSIGAGMGANILGPISRAVNRQIYAYCIDLAHEAFEHGREACRRLGIGTRVEYIHGDANHVSTLVKVKPDVVTMLGIIEYLTDEQVHGILCSMHAVMDEGGPLLVNATADASGTDRFVRTIFDLHILYRPAEHVKRLLESAGFEVVQAKPEPVGIYTVLVAEKRRVSR